MEIRSLLTVAVLAVTLAGPASAEESYKRPRWSHPEHTCRDTRAVVLTQRCRFVEMDARGCHVKRAECLDIYTDREIITDTAAQSIQIDHLLPAVEAWRRRQWSPTQYSVFFNDPDNLVPTRSRTNDQKGSRMPAEWCPASRGARILAAKRLRRVAARYEIPLFADDQVGLAAWEKGECAASARVLGNEE